MHSGFDNAKPIESYGLILFCKPEKGPVKFLIYQRRDNYEYIDILRGNWGNEKRLLELFSALSLPEKERIQNYKFDELWDDLWVTSENKIHKDGYAKAKRRFELIKNKIPEFLKKTANSASEKTELQWGFPKGKRNGDGETAKDCALREFKEETGIFTDDITVLETERLSEFYKGNNGKPYCTHYYLADAKKMYPIKRVPTPGCIRIDAVSDEAEDAKWVTYEEALEYLGERRREILKKAMVRIRDI